MSYSRLPFLVAGVRVDPETARQDRVQFSFSGYRIEAQEGDKERFLHDLAAFNERRPIGQPDGRPVQLFDRVHPPMIAATKRTLNFVSPQTSSSRQPYRFLYRGKLECRRRTPIVGDAGNAVHSLEFHLTLNFTRALVHQETIAWHRRLSPEITIDDFPTPALVTRPRVPRSDHEHPFADFDNVVLEPRAHILSTGHLWPTFREVYLRNSLSYLRSVLGDTADAVGAPLQLVGESDLHLKEVETYWEFQTEDALWAIDQISPHFQAYADQANLDEYANAHSGIEAVANSKVLKCRLRQDVQLKIYAKTNRRIRFEITAKGARGIGRGLTQNLDETTFLNRLDSLAEQGAGDVNRALSFIADRAFGEDAVQRPPYELVKEIIRACPDNEVQQEHLLSIIINNGAYTLENSDPLRPAIERLINRNILVRSGDAQTRRRRKILHQSFTTARNALLANQSSETNNSQND